MTQKKMCVHIQLQTSFLLKISDLRLESEDAKGHCKKNVEGDVFNKQCAAPAKYREKEA